MSHAVLAQCPTPAPNLFSPARGGVGDSGGGSLPCESALSLSHAGVPGIGCLGQGALGLSHQGHDSGWGTPQLWSLAGRVCPPQVLPGRDWAPAPLCSQELPFASSSPSVSRVCKKPGEDTGCGGRGKEKDRKEKSCLDPLLSKQGNVVNRSWGSELTRPDLSLYPSTYSLGNLGHVLRFSEPHL